MGSAQICADPAQGCDWRLNRVFFSSLIGEPSWPTASWCSFWVNVGMTDAISGRIQRKFVGSCIHHAGPHPSLPVGSCRQTNPTQLQTTFALRTRSGKADAIDSHRSEPVSPAIAYERSIRVD